MGLFETIPKIKAYLQENERMSIRMIKREFDLDDEDLEELIEELVDVQQVAVQDGKILVWSGADISRNATPPPDLQTIERKPQSYTPKHLAEKILQSRSALEGERKQVTVLFADVKGSMDLAGQLGPEEWHDLLDRFFSILNDGIHRFEGTVNQYTGDGIMALFGAPIAHEDHAQRACYAALQMRAELRRLSVELRVEKGIDFSVRIGLNSGDVVVGKIGDDLRMDYTAQGQTVGIAQRIEQLAESGRVYLGKATEKLVRGYFQLKALGPAKLKGVEETTEVFELEGVSEAHSRIEVAEARGLTKFVGRAAEMETIETGLAHAREGYGQVIGVVGDPGLGKSRLCYEFAQHCRAQGLAVYEAHCPPHGKNVPFLPILELFRNYFGITPGDTAAQSRRKIADGFLHLDPELSNALPIFFEFMGVADADINSTASTPEARQRVMYALIQRVTHARAQQGETVVVLIDDLHWIDPGSDTYIEQIVEAVEGSRTLLLLNFRPEYEASWSHRSHYQQLPLVPLGSKDVRELVNNLLGTDATLKPLKERILTWTQGNPFFAEEVVQTLVETNALERSDVGYRLHKDVESLEVPTNVRAVLAARIDRLPPGAKYVLQRAAVIGKEFDAEILSEIVDGGPETMQSALDVLKHGGFVLETTLFPTASYAFKHPLSHEVAYESLLGANRKETHEAVASALQQHAGERLDEMAPLLAHHWDTAGNIERALEWHKRAATWAEVNDAPASQRHWQRVRTLVDQVPENKDVLSLGALACTHLLLLGWRLGAVLDEARKIFEDGANLARSAEDDVLLSTLTGGFSVMFPTVGRAREYCEYGMEAARLADATGNPGLRGSMRHFASHGHLFLGNLDTAISIAAEGYEFLPEDPNVGAEFTGASPRLSMLFALQCAAILQGRFADADRYYEETERLCKLGDFGDQNMWGTSLTPLQALLQGTSVDAKVATDAMELGERLGTWFSILIGCWGAALTYRVIGDHSSALVVLRRYIEVENKVPYLLSPTMYSNYAEVLLETGETDEAFAQAKIAVDQSRVSGFAWDARPWLALARTAIAIHDQATAKAALNDLHAEIERTTAWAYAPFLHETRANYAAAFHDAWRYDDEIREAHRLFAELGASNHAERLRRLVN